jgi:hypothetical protein
MLGTDEILELCEQALDELRVAARRGQAEHHVRIGQD